MDEIKAIDLTKKYRDTVAVDSISFSVKKGELVCLLGINGAGKTTTIKMLSCLCRPTNGDAFINGKSIISQTAYVKSIIGVSPQETAVANNLSVKENLELMCGIHGFCRQKQKDKINELCERFELYEVLNKRATFGRLAEAFEHCHGTYM